MDFLIKRGHKKMLKRSSGILILVLVLMTVLSACGGGEWDKVSKKGNTWQYDAKKAGMKQQLTATVIENYKIGDKKYAEVKFDGPAKGLSMIYTWNKDKEAVITAGRNSRFDDKTIQFFIKESIIGQKKVKKGEKLTTGGGTFTFLGEEKVKVPAGEFTALKFNLIDKKGKSSNYWYVSKTGFVKIESSMGTLELKKFTEGKGGDPVKPGPKDNADKAFALAKTFYNHARKGAVDKINAMFVKGASYSKVTLKLLIDRIKNIGAGDIHSSIYFMGTSVVAIRSRYLKDGENPNVMRLDAMLTLQKSGDGFKIKTYSVIYRTIVK